MAILRGTNKKNTIVGTSRGDQIFGLGGDDVLKGGAGNDTIDGGAGSDQIDGGGGNDTIKDASGTNRLRGDSGNDKITGGSGVDTIDGGTGDDQVQGGGGNDTIKDASGKNRLLGGSGNDKITGGSGRDTIDGGSGNDVLVGGGDKDLITGGTGHDTMTGGAGNDTLSGGTGTDVAVFSGPISDYDFVYAAGKLTITHARGTRADGVDTISADIESLKFSGLTVANTEAAIRAAKNTAPVAQAFSGTTNEDSVFNGSVSGSDADGDAVSFTLVNDAGEDIAAPAGLTFNSDGSFAFTPPLEFQALDTGESQPFTFKFVALDGLARSAVQTATITIDGSNDGPQADDLSDSVQAGTTYFGSVTARDADDTALTFVVVDQSGAPATVPAGVTFDTNGTFTVAAQPGDQDLVPGQTREVRFFFAASDGEAVSAPAAVVVTISGVNDPPSASAILNAPLATEDAETVTLDLLDGVTDPDPGSVFSISITGALPGGITLLSDGHTLALDPAHPAFDVGNQGQTATYDVAYTVSDQGGASIARTARFSVAGINDAPTAVDVSGSTTQNAAVQIALGGDDPDQETTPANLTYQLIGSPPAGVAINGSVLTFNPGANFTSLAKDATEQIVLNYNAQDTHGTVSGNASITITITGTNDAPSVGAAAVAVQAAAGSASAEVVLSATDPDNDNLDPTSLTYYVAQDGFDFAAAISADLLTPLISQTAQLSYTGDLAALAHGVTATERFAYVAEDAHGSLSNAGAIVLTVTGINDAPVLDEVSSDLDVLYDVGDTEAGAPSGLLVATDVDVGDTLEWTAALSEAQPFSASVSGVYGNLVLGQNSEGAWNWSYTLTADLSGIVEDFVEESFVVRVQDAHAGALGFSTLTDTAVLVITILPPPDPFAA